MILISLPRGNGKTVTLIKLSAETRTPILCYTRAHKKYVEEKAIELGLDIPTPLFYCGRPILGVKEIIVDEVEALLRSALGTKISFATFSEEEGFNGL
ncbi:hypothetical protein [Massilibacteroides sp.]|uniref:hypothetical protein n=1 Tax=Massilibacteroides sp. TaxID=2034766 RepID=UPI002634017B|nr:hypothetical protein [Massilibacteroides sp.]MDD4516566.1 hypothetical protein [Massilibacteroides sp.]